MRELIELREKLAAKSKALKEYMDSAKVDGVLDPVKTLKLSGVDFAEKVKSMNDELDDIHDQIEKLRPIEDAEIALKRQKVDRDDPPKKDDVHPDRTKHGRDRPLTFAERVMGQKAFVEQLKNRPQGEFGVTLDIWPSELPQIGLKTLFETGAGWAPESVRLPGIVDAVTRPIQILDIVPAGRTSQAAVPYMEETTRTHAAAEKAEGAAYAESTFVLTQQSKTVRKITDSIPVTDEQLDDVPQVETYLNGRLMFGVRQRLDGQIIAGDDIAPNLDGLSGATGLQTQAKGADPVMDAIFKAMVKVQVTGRANPTHSLLHPNDWQDIRLTRTADGIYILGNPSEAGPERLWGRPVVVSDALTENTGYTGAFSPEWCTLFERKGVTVSVGYVADQFKEGERTIRAEMRAAMVWFRGAAFCSVTGI